MLVLLACSDSPHPTSRLVFASHCLSYKDAVNLSNTLTIVMQRIINIPGQKVRNIDLVSQHHIDQIHQWNYSNPDNEPTTMILDIIYQQVLSRPNAQAIDAWDGSLTYLELDNLSSRLARHLQNGFEVHEEAIVPILFEKSLWAIVAVLAVVKAGGVCTPMDPSHPVSRLEYIVEDIRPQVMLTSADYVDHLPSAKRIPTIAITRSEIEKLATTGPRLGKAMRPSLGAYCIYTSGSTGKPKGCIHDHRSLATCFTLADRLLLDRSSRALQFASFGFVRSVVEIFCALSVGATLCVPSEHDRVNALGKAISRMGVTWAMQTSSMLSTIDPDSVSTLQTLILGAETTPRHIFEAWSGKAHIIQSFGLTESLGPILSNNTIVQSTDNRNVGFSLRGNCWLADPLDHQKLSPIGAVSELILEGPSLARGYVNMSVETSAAFLNDAPKWYSQARKTNNNSLKLCKTGDLVRYNADGSILYIGRKDTAVKIHGQRVEVAEIEQVISQALSGKVAVETISPRDRPDMHLLAAFVCLSTASSNKKTLSDEQKDMLLSPDNNFRSVLDPVERALRNKLPAYMIPSLYISIQSMPVNASGKLIRRELKNHARKFTYQELQALSSPSMTLTNIPPATDIERTVHKVTSDLLKVSPESFGMNHNFIRLGGDSLSAMRMVSMLCAEGHCLAVSSIMSNPKLSEIARLVSIAKGREINPLMPLSRFSLEQREDIRMTAAAQCQIDTSKIEEIYSCTALQEGLIVLSEKRSGMSMARFVYEIDDGLSLPSFKSAWDAVFYANLTLRTRFVLVQSIGKFFQIVVEEETEWRTGTDLAKYKDLDDKMQTSVLGTSLVRTALITEGLNTYFVLTMHHALFDQWSLRIILTQLQELCDDSTKVPGKTSFSRFAHYIDSNATEMAQYWRSEFVDLNAETFPALPSLRYISRADKEIIHQIKFPCKLDSDYTMSNAIRLAWGLVVSQYTNCNDVVFGVTTSGRGAMVAGIETMTGPTIATVPLRLRLVPDDSIDAALSAVQKQATSMIGFEQMGIQDIQKCSPEAWAACQFQSQLVVQPDLAPVTGKLVVREQGSAIFGGFSNYAFVLVCTLNEDGLGIAVNATVDSNVVKPQQAKHFIALFDCFVTQIVTNSQRSIRSLSTLSSLDIDQLRKWNTYQPHVQNECVTNYIDRQFVDRREAPVVCAWDGNFTYKELESRSSLLASKLIERSIGPECFVPLLFEKSCWTVVAMLGVIKAGAAFVLLDPSHPESRLRGICHDVDCRLILSSTEKSELCNMLGFEKMLVNEPTTSTASGQIVSYRTTVHHENALYVVFTSGSTGKPKGVVIEHWQYSSAVHNYKKAFHLDPSVRVLQFSSYAFDASIIEMLTTLMVGGCICIPSDSQRLHSLASSIRELNANHAFLTPSVARLLIAKGVEKNIKTLALVGEPMLDSDVEYWADKVSLINGYGPAECSIACCINPSVTAGIDPANLGSGRHAGTLCWVVDPQDATKLLPVGAVGELLVQGPSVGRGYLNDPIKTEATFVQRKPVEWPFQIRQEFTKQYRMYRTGDLVRYDVHGSLCYVGRKDLQIKLRGQRIELGEVESHLRRRCHGHDVVAEVVVPMTKIPRLVAFITSGEQLPTAGNTEISGGSILDRPTERFQQMVLVVEQSLGDELPIFMVPTLYIPILYLPKTSSGKIDRRLLREAAASLSAEDIQSYSIRQETVSNRQVITVTEVQLQTTWARLLDIPVDDISPHDSFFHLGGDSILAMRSVAAMASQGKHITVADVFKYAKLSDLAEAIDSNSIQSLANQLQAKSSFSIEDQELCAKLKDTLPQTNEWFEDKEVAEVIPVTAGQTVLLNQCSIAHFRYLLNGVVDSDRLRDACAALLVRHSIFRTVFIEWNHRYFQVILENLSTPFSHIVYDGEDDLETYCKFLFVNEHQKTPFDKPPFGVILVSAVSNKEHVLIIRLNHAQYDGISFPVLLRDLGAIYRGDMNTLPPATQFSTYTRQRSLPEDNPAFDFWRCHLSGSQMTPLNPEYMKLGLSINARAVVRSKTNTAIPATPPTITLATLVKAAWSYVLAQFRQETDVVFGQTVTGRALPLAGANEIQGLCLNFIPTRTTIHPEDTVLDLLHRTQNQHMETLQYDYVDLEDIIKHSTTWDAGTKYGCILQFQSKGGNHNLLLNQDQDVTKVLKHAADVDFLPLEETWVFVFKMLPTKTLHLFILTRQEIMGQELADMLIFKFREAIEVFSQFPDEKLSSLGLSAPKAHSSYTNI